MKRIAIFTFLLLATSVSLTRADDWPHWLGPKRDGTWREAGVVSDRFPEGGPKIDWRVPVGHGYGSPAVAGGKVYLMDYVIASGEVVNNPSGRSPLEGKERVRCFDAATGKEIWSHAYERPYNLSYPGGPRCTPAVAEGKVYALGAEGDLLCLNATDGDVIWKKDLQKEYGTESPIWGFAAHPLVHGDTLYCIVGGQGSVAVAFDKDTGAEKWRALTAAEPGYCPPTLIEHAGVAQLLVWHPESINALNPASGEVYWSLPLKPSYGMSIMAPRKSGSKLFASAIGRVGALIALDDEKPAASFAWRATPKQAVFCANSTPHIVGDMIYGCDVDTSALVGARLSDGERVWTTTLPTLGTEKPERRARHGTAFLTRHEESGRFFLFSETGDLILADLTPEGYAERSRAHILEPTNEAFGRPVVWSAPAFAMKSAFVRNDVELVRVNLAADAN